MPCSEKRARLLLARARERAEAAARYQEDLARSDWHFDTNRMYHSRDHWD